MHLKKKKNAKLGDLQNCYCIQFVRVEKQTLNTILSEKRIKRDF